MNRATSMDMMPTLAKQRAPAKAKPRGRTPEAFAARVIATCAKRNCSALVVRDPYYGFSAHYAGSRQFKRCTGRPIGVYNGNADPAQLADDVRPYWGGR